MEVRFRACAPAQRGRHAAQVASGAHSRCRVTALTVASRETCGGLVLRASTHYDDELAGSSLDHFVGPDEDGLRDCQAKRLRRLQVDDEFELGGLLDRKIGRLRALQDLV